MSKIKIKLFSTTLIAGVVALSGLTSFLETSAIEAGRSFALSPMNQKVMLMPGETYNGSINVINPHDSKFDFYYTTTVGTYGVNGDENSIDDYANTTIDSEPTGYSQIVNWIKLENDTGVLAPNETATISFSINVPENAPGGGQYATILVQENPQTSDAFDNSSNVQEIMRMGSVIYAEVAGDTIKEGEIISNNIPAFLMRNQLEAVSMVRNNGNIHTDAEYILQVWPLFSDEEICTNEENPTKSMILPETKRYNIESCDLTIPGIYKVKQIVKIFGEESTAEKVIIYCPLWLLFVIFFAIVAIIIWLVTKSSARKKAAKK